MSEHAHEHEHEHEKVAEKVKQLALAGEEGEAKKAPVLSSAAVRKAAKEARQAEIERAREAARTKEAEEDPARDWYGQLAVQFATLAPATGDAQEVAGLEELHGTSALVGQRVTVRARVQGVRVTGKHAFLVLRAGMATVQAVVSEGQGVSRGMVRFAGALGRESVVQCAGELRGAQVTSSLVTQQTAELAVDRLFVVHAAQRVPPFAVEDAARAEEARADASAEEHALPRVLLDTRLNHRVVDLRTATNQAVFRIQAAVGSLMRAFLEQHGFTEIHSPKLIPAASEGGASVFRVSYFKQEAFLAQSPQFYKQMAICGDMQRVYEIGPVFRAENSFTHRHLTEFTGVDLEMAIQHHYHEAMLLIGRLLMHVFAELPRRMAPELAAVRRQYPMDDFVLPPGGTVPVLQYPEAVALLRAHGVPMGDFDDLSTETERVLGRIVRDRFHSDFFILDKFPLACRPFYTMPDPERPGYANAYDFFMRGEEILSGAQRVHDPEMLAARALALGIDPASIAAYIDAFRYGAPPHAGGGIGLERVVMFYLGLKNIRMTSLFPRDPTRITP